MGGCGTEAAERRFSPEERRIFRMMTGFFTSRVLAVAMELDLFSWLATAPRSFAEIGPRLGFAERPCRIFLDCLVSAGLLEDAEGRYRNSTLADALLVRGRPDFQGPHVRLFDHLYAACGELETALREHRPTTRDYGYFFETEAPAATRYSGLMHDSSVVPALMLPQYFDFSECRRVLDVGGGWGRLGLTLAAHHPDLEVTVVDLPEVCVGAQARIREHPHLADRVHVQPADFLRDELPRGADTIVMMRILHDWPKDHACRVLRNAYEALPSGGRLLVYETFKDDDRQPGDAAFVSLLLLLISPGGECRTYGEVEAWLREVGFAAVELIPTVYFYGLVVATKA